MWQEPKEPNGLIVLYEVSYRRYGDEVRPPDARARPSEPLLVPHPPPFLLKFWPKHFSC